jgi:hypothetical protein
VRDVDGGSTSGEEKTNDDGTLGSEWSELNRLAVYSAARSFNVHAACPSVPAPPHARIPLALELASMA